MVVGPPGGAGGAGKPKGKLGDSDDITISVSDGAGQGGNSVDQELKDLLKSLPEKERKALEEAIRKAVEEAQRQNSSNPADHASMNLPDYNLDSMAPHLRATIDRMSKNLSASSQQNLETSARATIDQSQASALSQNLPSALKTSYNQKTKQNQIEFSKAPSEEKAREIEARMQELAERLESEVKRASEQMANRGSSTV